MTGVTDADIKVQGGSVALHGAEGGNDIDGKARGESDKQSKAITNSDIHGGGARRWRDVHGRVRRRCDV